MRYTSCVSLRSEDMSWYFKDELYVRELAQLPISVFLNNTLQQTVTLNGTEGQTMERVVTLPIRQDGEKYMKLYFGESGIDMHRMFLRYVGKNDIESIRNE